MRFSGSCGYTYHSKSCYCFEHMHKWLLSCLVDGAVKGLCRVVLHIFAVISQLEESSAPTLRICSHNICIHTCIVATSPVQVLLILCFIVAPCYTPYVRLHLFFVAMFLLQIPVDVSYTLPMLHLRQLYLNRSDQSLIQNHKLNQTTT